MAGNLVPVTKSGDQLYINFHAFRENRLPFLVRVRDGNQESVGRIAFMKEPKVSSSLFMGLLQVLRTPFLNFIFPSINSIECIVLSTLVSLLSYIWL